MLALVAQLLLSPAVAAHQVLFMDLAAGWRHACLQIHEPSCSIRQVRLAANATQNGRRLLVRFRLLLFGNAKGSTAIVLLYLHICYTGRVIFTFRVAEACRTKDVAFGWFARRRCQRHGGVFIAGHC